MTKNYKPIKLKYNEESVRETRYLQNCLPLEDVFKKLSWGKKGIRFDESYLNNLPFADDIVLISSDVSKLGEMLEQLNNASKKVGLRMNLSKIKIMSDIITDIIIEHRIVENVNEYVYLVHAIKLVKKNQTAEINRRIGLTWAAVGRLRYILKDGTIPINLKRKVYESCILLVATYGLETMTLTERSVNRLRTTQRAMDSQREYQKT